MSPATGTPVQVLLRYADLDTFMDKFAANVTKGGIFLASREPRPVGDCFRFEVCLSDGSVVFSGEGRVSWTRQWNPAEPRRAHGMGVQFMNLNQAERAMLERLLARRERPRVPAVAPAPPAAASTPKRPKVAPTALDFETFTGEVEETIVRRARDRARVLAGRDDDLEALLVSDAREPATLAMALSDLPRLLAGPGARRNSGLFRVSGGDSAGKP